ncbi:hypothetical protein JHK85_009686 [Glycine max]|uniref:Uncharacterized protein n=2 Tax=Glycine subgen. Soja TaxID=1462606 RepID=K7KIX4_SOYBN|nr:hypothetical protein JHK85_009686 [Glycine max]RZC15676.1 hypothetical protein D0Y65_009151 [Glycine soja]
MFIQAMYYSLFGILFGVINPTTTAYFCIDRYLLRRWEQCGRIKDCSCCWTWYASLLLVCCM